MLLWMIFLLLLDRTITLSMRMKALPLSKQPLSLTVPPPPHPPCPRAPYSRHGVGTSFSLPRTKSAAAIVTAGGPKPASARL